MKNFDVAVIGGGAAGLACALKLKQLNKNVSVAVIEAGERAGKKLSACGNGQGNVGNSDIGAAHYFSGNIALCEKIILADTKVYEKLFLSLFSADSEGRVYPAGRQASSLAEGLYKRVLNSGAQIYLSTKALKIEKGFEITVCGADGKTDIIRCTFLCVCAGGKAQKQFKTDGSAYSLVTCLGHSLTRLYPSLVQLKTDISNIKTLKGIRADCIVRALVGGKEVKVCRGDVIFTEYGVSGNAAFKISSYVCGRDDAYLSLEFLPDFNAEQIIADIEKKRKEHIAETELLSGSLHAQIGRAIIKRAQNEKKEICSVLKNFVLPVTGTLGFDYAQVTRGGVDMKEVNDSLESKIVPNLYFAGEILDVDGECGGYNLHWAFSSGVYVAEKIAEKIKGGAK